MKVYLIYLLPKKKLYAFTDNKCYLERFLLERNEKLFKVKEKTIDDDSLFLLENISLHLNVIPLENKDGDCNIIGTNTEEAILDTVCEKMGEVCDYLKVHLTKNVPFNIEYKSLLEDLTTITKNTNNHPIIQMDTVKLFYYLFKETFIEQNEIDYIDDTDDFIKKYKFL